MSGLTRSLIIETPRLIVRSWQPSDREGFISLCQAEGFSDFSSGRFESMTEAKAESFVAREIEVYARRGFCRFAVALKSSGALIGIAGLFEMSEVNFKGAVGLGYRFPREHWGQGYATESCRELLRRSFEARSFNEVVAIIDSQNDQSRRVALKLGFECLGENEYRGQLKEVWICRG